MIKLFRSLRAENMRLYFGAGAILTIAAVFLIALAVSFMLGSGMVEPANELIGSTAVAEPSGIQDVILQDNITKPYSDWRDSYRARFDELTALNESYTALAQQSTGAESAAYLAKQQECIREALIINKCLDNDTATGYSKAWNTVNLTLWLMLLPVSAFAAAVMASKTAGEFKSGAMNILYTLPATRMKQYFAKYLSAALFALLLCASAFSGSIIGAMLGCGGMTYTGNAVRVLGESVTFTSFFSLSAELALCLLLSTLVLLAFCAAVATVSHSQGAAVALTVILCAAAMLFGRALGESGNLIGGLSVVSVLDISAPLRGLPNYSAAGYAASWLCASVYWLIFIICGYLGMRRDVR